MAGMLSGMLVLSVSSCVKDDFDRNQNASDALSFEVEVSGGWSEAAAVSSTSIRRMSQSTDAEPLYLVTQVSDSAPVSAESGVVTRGTPVETAGPLETGGFGLSAICYTGTWPEGEGSTNNWTTNFAHNLNVTMQDGHWKAPEKLEWPGSGNIRFFAYYPYSANSNGCIAHSGTDVTGSPVLTYTVPDDVKNQPDLLWAVTNHSGKSDAGGTVNLEFQHALTAVTIKTGTDMLSGTITGVKISGVYGKGSCRIGGTTWTTQDETRDFKITDLSVALLPTKKDDKNGLMINTGSGQNITSSELTFMMVPQTLPEGAKLTINFTDKLTNTARTLTADIGNTSWPSGKKVAYSINSSGIVVKTKFEFSKNPDSDIMPYSGVWYDATYKATVEVTQVGETKTIPLEKVKFQYKLENEPDWTDCTDCTDCTTDDYGLLTIPPQPAYTAMRGKFTEKGINIDTEGEQLVSLSTEKGEPANCYLVDRAGYYSLDLVYGNGKNLTVPAGSTGLKYFPGYDNQPLPGNGIITDAADAVLLWQDAPDLIDPNSVGIKDGKLVFRIRKHTLTQGNAVLAVRKDEGGKKVIIWSWHIWVTPYKNDFYNTSCTSTTYLNMTTKDEKLREYEFAMYNLGWCDSHGHDDSRKFSLRAVVDMSAYGVEEPAVVSIPGEFTQMEYRGSDAGDNTYYQWGRKDPMLGGIYNSKTPKYTYNQRGTTYRDDEFNMENKQLFNQYNQDGYDYRFCKNVGDKLTELNSPRWKDDGNSHGVFIGYTIQHPYMFITNSRMQYVDPASGNKPEGGDPLQKDDPALLLDPDFNFRGHWHKPRALEVAPYLEGDTDRIMFNAWDAGALEPGKQYSHWGTTSINPAYKGEYLKTNASDVQKTVFDPCPPGFKVPPVDAFRGAESYSGSGNTRTITFGTGKSTDFPVTGVRNYALRSNEWTTVVPAKGDANFDQEAFYRTTMPAWSSVSFVSTATLVLKDQYNRYQLFYFWPTTAGTISSLYTGTSSNSYGLSVRPIKDIKD